MQMAGQNDRLEFETGTSSSPRSYLDLNDSCRGSTRIVDQVPTATHDPLTPKRASFQPRKKRAQLKGLLALATLGQELFDSQSFQADKTPETKLNLSN